MHRAALPQQPCTATQVDKEVALKPSNWIHVAALATFILGAVGAGALFFLVPSIPSSVPFLPETEPFVIEEEIGKLQIRRDELTVVLRQLGEGDWKGVERIDERTLVAEIKEIDNKLDHLQKQEIALAV